MNHTPALSKQLKRLGLIKGLILLEEFEDALAHFEKMDGLGGEAGIKKVIADINTRNYADAVRKIDTFINKHQTLMIYEDPEIEALKIEIKYLETEISNASNEIVETEKLMHDFGLRHSRELGELVSKILQHHKERAAQQQHESSAKHMEFEEAQKDYDQNQYEESKKEIQFELTAEEKQELKKKYHLATLLCHFDVVIEELDKQVETVFNELQAAYKKNDLRKVSDLLAMLENSETVIAKSEGINGRDVKLYVSTFIDLRKILKDLQHELITLKKSEPYQTIKSIDNWDEYFLETKEKLSQELKTLEN